MQESSIATPSRSLRYSGRERPAWRMNHTGVCPTGSRRQARRNTESAAGFAAGFDAAPDAGSGGPAAFAAAPSDAVSAFDPAGPGGVGPGGTGFVPLTESILACRPRCPARYPALGGGLIL